MSIDRIMTKSVARDVAITDPIVLRDSEDKTRRLVFVPTLLDRANSLRGYFVYQRKAAHEEWEDIRGTPLSSLKAGEGYTLELRSAEVSRLLEGLLERRELYEKHGISFGTHDYVSKSDLPQIMRSIVDSPGSELAGVLGELDEDDILGLGRKVDLSKLDFLLSEWRSNQDNGSEEFWQDLLTRNAWVFSQLTGSPVVLLKDKAYVGGKSIANAGGGEVDYLCQNELTDNLSFIEIKTPITPICGASYRTSGSFALDNNVTGGIVQVLGYKERFEKEFYPLRANTSLEFHSYNPRCHLILGRAATLSEDEMRSFELFRNSLASVQILTFDEVATRLQGIRDALTS